MDFNWSTFILEIINFLVLVWLIKHFFYKPVCKIIDKRRSEIDEQITSAKSIQADAQAMKEQYENRLTEWEEEKQQQQIQLTQEIEEQKKQRLTLLEKQIAEEKQKNVSIQDKRLEILQQKNEAQALDQGVRFATKLIQDLSSQEMENKVIELFLKNLANFSLDQKQNFTNIYSEEKPNIVITSAYSLSQIQKENLQKLMQDLFEHTIDFEYIVDPEIIAGLRVNIGSYVMHANLADELLFFSDSANGY
jgi:F-type H+-transporting ATPase subunit b